MWKKQRTFQEGVSPRKTHIWSQSDWRQPVNASCPGMWHTSLCWAPALYSWVPPMSTSNKSFSHVFYETILKILLLCRESANMYTDCQRLDWVPSLSLGDPQTQSMTTSLCMVLSEEELSSLLLRTGEENVHFKSQWFNNVFSYLGLYTQVSLLVAEKFQRGVHFGKKDFSTLVSGKWKCLLL